MRESMQKQRGIANEVEEINFRPELNVVESISSCQREHCFVLISQSPYKYIPHYEQFFCVGVSVRLSLVRINEELLERKVAAPV
jgi:hypothetical protein